MYNKNSTYYVESTNETFNKFLKMYNNYFKPYSIISYILYITYYLQR